MAFLTVTPQVLGLDRMLLVKASESFMMVEVGTRNDDEVSCALMAQNDGRADGSTVWCRLRLYPRPKRAACQRARHEEGVAE